jgi:hypothetical protein
MSNKIKLELVKDENGIMASNETEGTIEFFDETEEARKEFVMYFLEEFINKEVK